MEEHGKVVLLCTPREGTSPRTGEKWMSQDFVLFIDGRYSRYVKLSIFGRDKVQKANLQLGEYVTAKFEIEAHEYQGNWYNELRVFDVVVNGASRIYPPTMPQQTTQSQTQISQQTQQYAQALGQQTRPEHGKPYADAPF